MSIVREWRVGLRTLAKHPLVTAAAVVTLALGIGANTTMFSFVKAVLIDPFAYRDPNNTVLLWSENAALGDNRRGVSVADFRDWRERSRSFDRMALGSPVSVTLTGLKEPERITAVRVSQDLFSFFDSTPSLGREFLPGEYGIGADHSVIVSQGFWRSHFGADSFAVGQTIHLDGESYTIVGVMPASFWFPSRFTAMWLPLTPAVRPDDRTAHISFVLAHLRPGVTLQQANQELSAVSRQLAAEYPLTNTGWSVRAYERIDAVLGPNDRVFVALLFAVVGALLLVACANVANLLLAQAAVRRREIAIRTAVGATRWHLFRQSLAESLLLGGLAGGLGLLAGAWAKDLLIAIFPSDILLTSRPADPAVLAFCLAISLLAVLLFGTVPAWDFSRGDPNTALKEGRTSGARTHRLAGAFVCAQIALTMVVLIGTGLLLQTMRHLRELDLGCQPKAVAVAQLQPSPTRHEGDQKLRLFYRAVMERAANLPGAESVAAASALPILSEGVPVHVSMMGDRKSPAELPTAMSVTVTPRYFQTIGNSIQQGREFNVRDDAGAPRVAVVNRAFAGRFWKGADPIGKRMRVGESESSDAWTIVGISADVRPPNIQEAAHPQIYVPFAQAPQRNMAVILKSRGDPAALLGGIRAAVLAVDKDEPVEAKTMMGMLHELLRSNNIILSMLAIFAGLALTMASVGLFALVAYSVNERTREIGIRIALGASRNNVLGLVLWRGLKLAALGMAVGLLGAAAAGRLIRSLLIATSPWDPAAFLSVSVLLMVVGGLASYLPARRAMRTDPVIALRDE